jgi:hypothetical protein
MPELLVKVRRKRRTSMDLLKSDFRRLMAFGQEYNLHRWRVESNCQKIMPLLRDRAPPKLPEEMVEKSWASLKFRDVNENYEQIKNSLSPGKTKE